MTIESTQLIIDIPRLCDCRVTPKLGPIEAYMSLNLLGTVSVQGPLYKRVHSLGFKNRLLLAILGILSMKRERYAKEKKLAYILNLTTSKLIQRQGG